MKEHRLRYITFCHTLQNMIFGRESRDLDLIETLDSLEKEYCSMCKHRVYRMLNRNGCYKTGFEREDK